MQERIHRKAACHLLSGFVLLTAAAHAVAMSAQEVYARAAASVAALEIVDADGQRVRFVRSTLVPSDEIGLLVFEAESADAVREVARRAAIAYERIVEAVDASASSREE